MQSPLAWPPRPSDKIDAAVAGFAGLALGFAFVAMPEAMFASLIVRSGLPEIIPAASPPLGQTARAVVALAGGIGSFLALFLLLRALGGKPNPARAWRADRVATPPPPRVRRADSHPDAPARAPLLAGAELGEPFLGQAEPLELDQEVEEEPIDLPWRMAEEVEETGDWGMEPPREQVTLARGGFPEFPPLGEDPLPSIDTLPDADAEDDFDVSRLPEWEQREVRAPAFDALPQMATGSDGIPDLVERFERGLRRRAIAAESPREIQEPASSSFPAPAADPLANAISGLERLANRRA